MTATTGTAQVRKTESKLSPRKISPSETQSAAIPSNTSSIQKSIAQARKAAKNLGGGLLDDGGGSNDSPAPNTYTSPVVGKYLFYAGSSFAASSDNDAIATDKQPLDEADTAASDNYSSYTKGINGIFIDIISINGLVDENDFEFKVGNDDTPDDWVAAPIPTITTDVGGGAGGSDRVKLVWADNAIANQWLQVRIRGNTTTRVADDEIFYFGNVIGDTLDSTTTTRVNLLDVGRARSNQTGFTAATIDNVFDFNRDGRVNLLDVSIARSNQTGFVAVNLITPITSELEGIGFGRGVNFGNMLEAPNEGDWGLFVEERFFDRVVEGGFDHIRLPISWTTHASQSAPYTIDTAFIERVDWCVEQALDRGLRLIVNVHHYEELNTDPAAEEARALAIWSQIASRYQNEPKSIYFEILNEPHDAFNDDPALWNDFMEVALQVIRTTNPTRKVLIGPVGFNAISSLPSMDPPVDDNLIASVHFYEPFAFTHQGAEWVDPSPPVGTQWINDRVGFGSNWQSWSWGTTITPTIGSLGVEHTEGWAGLRFHANAAVSDVSSFKFTVNEAMALRVIWYDTSGVEINNQNLTTGSGTNEYTVDFGATVTIGDIVIQNLTPNPTAPYDLFTAELVGASGSVSLLETEEEAINNSFAFAELWSDTFEIPVHLGEFGAYDRADLASRERWTIAVREASEASDIPFSYWEFGAGFGIFDPAADDWRLTLLQALIPEFSN